MITVRRSEERGHFDHGWLDTKHTFSFADYQDPRFMGFRALRVINEDLVQPGRGFGLHSHRDMEIVTYLLEGALRHQDDLGHGSVIRPGDVQRMTAGTGISHAEVNASNTEPVHLLQVWILPERPGLPPSYEQVHFAEPERRGRLRLVASRDGREGSVTIHQDAAIHAGILEPGSPIVHALAPGRSAWIQVARGSVTAGGTPLVAGDGAAVTQEREIEFVASEPAEILLFDLA